MKTKLVLMVDGRYVDGVAADTILDITRRHGIPIPTLCELEGLGSIGACRLCVVEVKGVPRLLPACTTQAKNGMEISTDTPRLVAYRKMTLELLFAERNHVCSVCVSNGHCELQDMARTLGVDHVNFPYRYPRLGVDSSHDRFRMDHNRCILCTRCVRVCGEIEGAHTKDIKGRGIESMITNDLDSPWGESQTCTNCSKCVHVCPTGALTEKGTSVAEMQKRRQFLPYLTKMRAPRRHLPAPVPAPKPSEPTGGHQ
jgi:bidirectional [NiFe] hydrogenase diaphorase subunit